VRLLNETFSFLPLRTKQLFLEMSSRVTGREGEAFTLEGISRDSYPKIPGEKRRKGSNRYVFVLVCPKF
jgi:hypothetical protein